MALIKVADLSQGMILSKDVADSQDQLLIKKGQEILEQHIRVLKMRGIFEVDVNMNESENPDDPLNADPKVVKAVTHQVGAKFKNLDLKHPVIREIARLSMLYRISNGILQDQAPKLPKEKCFKASEKNQALSKIDRIDIKLPEVPSLVYELNEIIADPMSSGSDIGDVVYKSPSLAAMLLKIVNSSFYGFRSRIDSISRAVMLIGSKEISNLALGIFIMEAFKDIPKKIINVPDFMMHNLACGIIARLLAGHCKIAHTEQVFVSGMLHDIGRLVMFKYFPEASLAAINNACQTGTVLLKSELSFIGNTHTQVGKRLLEKWKLPVCQVYNVTYHHNPHLSPEPETAAIVHLADIIVHGLGVGNSVEYMVPAFDDKAWQSLNVSESVFESVINQATIQIEMLQNALSTVSSQ
ncbi:MAG: HDOD domain-containing protein [Desulfobacteraceae bacterium]|nr:HDOD domain-containing protein [Desulfobacteraceae bacterium]